MIDVAAYRVLCIVYCVASPHTSLHWKQHTYNTRYAATLLIIMKYS